MSRLCTTSVVKLILYIDLKSVAISLALLPVLKRSFFRDRRMRLWIGGGVRVGRVSYAFYSGRRAFSFGRVGQRKIVGRACLSTFTTHFGPKRPVVLGRRLINILHRNWVPHFTPGRLTIHPTVVRLLHLHASRLTYSPFKN